LDASGGDQYVDAGVGGIGHVLLGKVAGVGDERVRVLVDTRRTKIGFADLDHLHQLQGIGGLVGHRVGQDDL